jgi:nitrogenase molybdenum-iron protein beta chain
MSEKTFIERPRTFCALGGALQTIAALPNTVPILHSSMGCGAGIYYTQYGSTGYLGAGYCGGMSVPSSNIGEMEIVFGGVDRLKEQIENTLKVMDGELYVVLTGCTADMIGDDIQSVVREFNDSTSIIGVETGGFRGDGYKGYDLALQALFTDVVLHQTDKDQKKINLWGVVPGQDVFWRGNLTILKQLLEKLGLQINTFFTNGTAVNDIQEAGRAGLNVVVSPKYGTDAASVFQNLHDTPYISTQFPIGPTATDEFLRQVAIAAKIDQKLVENVIAEENRQYYFYVDRLADTFNDLDLQRYAVVVGDANYATALTRFLADDIGWLPQLTVVTDELAEEEHQYYEKALSDLQSGIKPSVVFETDASQILGHFRKLWPENDGRQHYHAFSPAFVLGSHLEREFAKNIGAGHLSISYPIGNRVVMNRGYAGYVGALTLIEDILGVIVAER